MSQKSNAFAKMLSTKIGTRNKQNKKARVKPVYDSAYFNLLIGKAMELPKMPDGKNVREWCATVKAPIVDVRLMVHENKRENVSCLRPENTVGQRLDTLATIDKRIAKVAYCRYLVNGTTDASDATNDNAYKVYLFIK